MSQSPEDSGVIDLLSHRARILRDASGPTIAGLAADKFSTSGAATFPDFRDEAGHAREVDSYLLRAALDADLAATSAGLETGSPDVHLWRATEQPHIQVESILDPHSRGPLFPAAEDTSIEVMTETELCGLHALWTIGRKRNRPDLWKRCLTAADWHVRSLESDNATNTPWAIHVFAVLGIAGRRDEALIDAEMRLNACLIAGSRPGGRLESRSALVLCHAATELDALVRDPLSLQRLVQTA